MVRRFMYVRSVRENERITCDNVYYACWIDTLGIVDWVNYGVLKEMKEGK